MDALLIASPALFALAACCFRISAWHSHEAAYWHNVAIAVRLDPTLDKTYRPILEWVQTHRPSVWQRVRGWQSPAARAGIGGTR